MSLFDDFTDQLAADAAKRRRYCGFGKWVRTLDAEDREKAELLVTGTDYNCRQLARYFQSKGATFNDQVLTRHRNGTCCGQRR